MSKQAAKILSGNGIIYVPKNVKVKKSKTGFGLFAMEPLRRGDFVIEYTGKIIPTKVADENPNRYLFEINKKWTIDGHTRKNIARYINCSCRPNCEPDIKKGRVLIFAKRVIKIGEELTCDYGEEYFNDYLKKPGCKCGFCDGTGKLLKKNNF